MHRTISKENALPADLRRAKALPTRDMSAPKPILHVPYGYMLAMEVVLGMIALSLCTTLGYYLHFERVTTTECMVRYVY